MKENTVYTVITGDLISSKKVDNRAVLQERIQEIMGKVNDFILLMEVIQEDWKEIHYKRYWLYKKLGTLEKVAAREGVSKQAIIKSLKVAKYEAILEAEESVRKLLTAFQSKINC